MLQLGALWRKHLPQSVWLVLPLRVGPGLVKGQSSDPEAEVLVVDLLAAQDL